MWCELVGNMGIRLVEEWVDAIKWSPLIRRDCDRMTCSGLTGGNGRIDW